MFPRTIRSLIPVSKGRTISSKAYTDAIVLLKADLKQAMINKDNLKKNTIRSLLSTIKNKEIDNKDKHFDEFMLYDIFSKMVSQRQESITNFIKNKRDDLVEKETQEIEQISQYLNSLPVASPKEIEAKVIQFLAELKQSQPDLKLPQVFNKIDWNTIPKQWKASPASIRSSIANNFKKSIK
ncbi:Aim41p Ecym_8320 [Eremothecium cymbalariae DBVPG|uniref:Altered inheritance of mitochondria protein 41 n=1 Tax=Eremothecium cymbalariae (strain CBS 270.75 / DBVPG 7215 / KCTC 17166 / NRRL Y-17582) TaxID=931890 RepID=G8JXM4_ERECY|nr:Hypothetical protein Ecym_8320 [Eremothecium cymbalariae DBVPG\